MRASRCDTPARHCSRALVHALIGRAPSCGLCRYRSDCPPKLSPSRRRVAAAAPGELLPRCPRRGSERYRQSAKRRACSPRRRVMIRGKSSGCSSLASKFACRLGSIEPPAPCVDMVAGDPLLYLLSKARRRAKL